MPNNGLTGLTAKPVSATRGNAKSSKPVRPVSLTGSDGSAVLIAHTRTHTERKAGNPSDPSGTRQAVLAAERGTRRSAAGVYHLIASQPLRLGYILCAIGEPLCGTTAALQPCLGASFAAAATCHICAALAEREHILIEGTEAA
jgi:hypothetical protein